jgi:hypothetical protein
MAYRELQNLLNNTCNAQLNYVVFYANPKLRKIIINAAWKGKTAESCPLPRLSGRDSAAKENENNFNAAWKGRPQSPVHFQG